MSVELTKINSNCNNINLLDLNECIGDSLKKINDAYLFFSNSRDSKIVKPSFSSPKQSFSNA
jgi:hypothetical protein